MDHGSVSDNTNSLHKLDPLHFQRPGSQYLGSDDSEGFRALVDPDFQSWAREMGLSDKTVFLLVEEGFKTKQHLSNLTSEALEGFGPMLKRLPLQQSLCLKRAMEALQSSKASSQAIPGLSQLLPEDEQARLLLVGKTGSGKSSTGNTILTLRQGEQFTEKFGMGAETKHCVLKFSEDSKVGVMDCPGLFDTSSTIGKVFTIIVKAMLGKKLCPSAFLYILRIGDRYTDEDFATYKNLKAVFGEDFVRRIIIVFTRGDDLKKRGITIEDYMQSAPQCFKEVLRECENRYVVFDNTLEGLNREQIDELHKKLQLVARGQRSHYELKHFPERDVEIEREIEQRLKELEKEFKTGQRPVSDEEKSFWRELWLKIKAFIRAIVNFFGGLCKEAEAYLSEWLHSAPLFSYFTS